MNDEQDFPDGFLWGASTAGHQVEGGNVNADLWPLEWAEETLFSEPSGDACDHYHRYPDDIATMAELGFNAYRFSLEWARIEPGGGLVQPSRPRSLPADDRHLPRARHRPGRHLFALHHPVGSPGRAAGRAPTRWRGSAATPNGLPRISATSSGGSRRSTSPTSSPCWSSPASSRWASVPAASVTSRIGWACSARPSTRCRRSTGRRSTRSGPGRATKVGWTLALVDLQEGADGHERWTAARTGAQLDWLEVSRDDDWVGVQTYTRNVLGADGPIPADEGSPAMQTDWEVYPEALGHTVRLAADHAAVPVIVTENGMATDDDEARIDYTRRALQGLREAIAGGIDVRGYLHWSLLDNFEWMAGYSKTFGLIAVDLETFERSVKPSARWLGSVAAANRLV
ncbi:MAG: family 1 glycosylhydrolase [Acidimicrobiales bacterium]